MLFSQQGEKEANFPGSQSPQKANLPDPPMRNLGLGQNDYEQQSQQQNEMSEPSSQSSQPRKQQEQPESVAGFAIGGSGEREVTAHATMADTGSELRSKLAESSSETGDEKVGGTTRSGMSSEKQTRGRRRQQQRNEGEKLLQGKNVLILGATGVIGSGAVCQTLEEGAQVFVVSKSDEKLRELMDEYCSSENEEKKKNLHGFVGSLDKREDIQKIHRQIKDKLSAIGGGGIDHVISSIGFVKITERGVTESECQVLQDSFHESLYPTIAAAQYFLPEMKNCEDSTYTIMNGGFRHECPSPSLWVAHIKNSAIHALVCALRAETKDNAVRINEICLHYGVAPEGRDKNQIGLDAQLTSKEFGKTFVAAIEKGLEDDTICFTDKEQTRQFLVT